MGSCTPRRPPIAYFCISTIIVIVNLLGIKLLEIIYTDQRYYNLRGGLRPPRPPMNIFYDYNISLYSIFFLIELLKVILHRPTLLKHPSEGAAPTSTPP